MAKDTASDNRKPHAPAALPAPEYRRSYVTRGLADLLPALTRPAYKKRSPAGAMLMSDWATIVGPRLAAETEPKRLSGTALTIACAGPMAMELQHVASTVIERINTHAGRKLVERLRFVQEPIAAPRLPQARRAIAPEALTDLPPGPLNDALARLRAAIRSR